MFHIDDYRCIAVAGGGGKTSLICYLAERLCARGKKVLIAASTHMRIDSAYPFVPWGEWDAARAVLSENGCAQTGVPAEDGKMTSPADAGWEALLRLCDVLLAEADGSRGLPLKVPAAHEPVIPDAAELVVGVAGLDALGKTVETHCHRPELVAELLGVPPDHRIREEDIARICCSRSGMRKAVGERDFKVLLNKADTQELRDAGGRIRERILSEISGQKGLEVAVTSLRRKKIAPILLAAGNSRRFGAENKLLYRVEGRTLFERTLERVMTLGCGPVTVVTQFEEIADAARERGTRVEINPHPEEGIASTIRIGVEANPQAEAYLLCVCDQPAMRAESLDTLAGLWLTSGKGIAAMSSEGKIVNPAIISRRYREELLALSGDTGAKPVILRHREDTALLEISPEEMEDMDIPPHMRDREMRF